MCQLDALWRCLTRGKLRKALKSLPKTFEDTYTRILDDIGEENDKDAFKVLQWLTYSARPLRIEEVAEVTALDIEGDPRFDPEHRLREPRDLLTICSSLVTLVASELRLAHFSVKEYLTSERIRVSSASKFSALEISAHLSIAETCLAYLLQFDKRDSLNCDMGQE